jgi:hypothetical protein
MAWTAIARRRRRHILLVALGALVCAANPAGADEGGISMWLPGSFASLAAAPQQPGWSMAVLYVHPKVSAGGDVAAAREATINGFNSTVNINLNANLSGRLDLVAAIPTYVFATPVFGGQLAVSLMGAAARNSSAIDGTLTVASGSVVATRTGTISDARTAFGDIYPQVSLRWNQGVHNVMIYGMGDIPVGAYDPTRLANIGIGHGAMDGGVGYTYLNPQTGYEFSAVTGVTYNLREITIPTIRTASIGTSTGAPRNSSTSNCSSAPPATCITS